MAAQLGDFVRPSIPPVVSTEELPRSLSQIVNRAGLRKQSGADYPQRQKNRRNRAEQKNNSDFQRTRVY
jgi:hypothetical protein